MLAQRAGLSNAVTEQVFSSCGVLIRTSMSQQWPCPVSVYTPQTPEMGKNQHTLLSFSKQAQETSLPNSPGKSTYPIPRLAEHVIKKIIQQMSLWDTNAKILNKMVAN